MVNCGQDCQQVDYHTKDFGPHASGSRSTSWETYFKIKRHSNLFSSDNPNRRPSHLQTLHKHPSPVPYPLQDALYSTRSLHGARKSIWLFSHPDTATIMEGLAKEGDAGAGLRACD